MSVVRSGKFIFCEGKENSIEEIADEQPTLIPSGSKFTFSVFIEGYFSSKKIDK